MEVTKFREAARRLKMEFFQNCLEFRFLLKRLRSTKSEAGRTRTTATTTAPTRARTRPSKRIQVGQKFTLKIFGIIINSHYLIRALLLYLFKACIESIEKQGKTYHT